jgi:hypothetical protein
VQYKHHTVRTRSLELCTIEDNSQRVGPDRCLAQCSRRKETWGGENDLYCGGSGKGHAVSAALAGAAQQAATVNSGRWYGI